MLVKELVSEHEKRTFLKVLTKHFQQDGALDRSGDVVVVGQASQPARRVLPLQLGDGQRVLDRPGEGLLIGVVQKLVVQVPQHAR